MKQKSLIFIVGLATAFVCGVSVVAMNDADAMTPRPSSSKTLTRNSQCFYSDQVSSFEVKNQRTMVVTTYRNEAFELELGPGCFDIDSAFGIAIIDRHGMGSVCGPFDAEVHYNDMGQRQSCSITAVRHLEGEEAAPYIRATKKPESEAKNEK